VAYCKASRHFPVRHIFIVEFSICSRLETFLGASEKLRKATVSFDMSVRPSVRPHGTTRLPLDLFS